MDKDFFVKAVVAFENCRDNTEVLFNNYIKRLKSRTLGLKFKNSLSKSTLLKKNSVLNKSFFKRFVFYEKQRKQLAKLKNKNPLIIGLASNRIIFKKNNLLNEIKSLMNSNEDNNKENIPLQLLKKKELIYVFDGFLESKLWNLKKENDTKIIINDIYFILYQFLLSSIIELFSFKVNNLKKLFKFFRELIKTNNSKFWKQNFI